MKTIIYIDGQNFLYKTTKRLNPPHRSFTSSSSQTP